MPKYFINSFFVLILRGLGSASSIILSMLVTRYLDINDASHILLLINLVLMVSTCLRWGLDEVIIRRVAVTSSCEIHGVINKISYLSHRRVGKLALYFLLFFLIFLIFDKKFNIYNIGFNGFVFILFSSFFNSLLACYGRIYQGSGRVNLAIFLLNVLVPGISCVLIWFLVFLNKKVSPSFILIEYASIIFFVYLSIFISYRKKNNINYLKKTDVDCVGDKDLRAANRLGVVVLAQQSLLWGSGLLVPAFYDEKIYAVFIVSQKISMIISFVMLTINFTISPIIAKNFSCKNYKKLKNLIINSGLIVGLVASVVAIIVIIFKKNIILYANINFIESENLLTILVISQIFNAISSFLSVVLSMSYRERFLMASQIIINLSALSIFTIFSVKFNIVISSSVFVFSNIALSLTLIHGIRSLLKEVMNSELRVNVITPINE